MPRPKKNSKSLNILIERNISDRFEAYCDAAGQTKTTAIERILKRFLDEYEQTKRKDDIL